MSPYVLAFSLTLLDEELGELALDIARPLAARSGDLKDRLGEGVRDVAAMLLAVDAWRKRFAACSKEGSKDGTAIVAADEAKRMVEAMTRALICLGSAELLGSEASWPGLLRSAALDTAELYQIECDALAPTDPAEAATPPPVPPTRAPSAKRWWPLQPQA